MNNTIIFRTYLLGLFLLCTNFLYGQCPDLPEVINEPVVNLGEDLNTPKSEYFHAGCQNCVDPLQLPIFVDATRGYVLRAVISFTGPFSNNSITDFRISQIDSTSIGFEEVTGTNIGGYTDGSGIVENGFYIIPSNGNGEFVVIDLEKGSSFILNASCPIFFLEKSPTTGMYFGMSKDGDVYSMELTFSSDDDCGVPSGISCTFLYSLNSLGSDFRVFRIDNQGNGFVLDIDSDTVIHFNLASGGIINSVALDLPVDPSGQDLFSMDFPNNSNLLYGYFLNVFGSINPLTGTVNLIYPQGSFSTSPIFSLAYSNENSVSWFNSPSSNVAVYAGNEFNPTGTTAEEGLFNTSIPGTYTYYIQCGLDQNCPRQKVEFTVNDCNENIFVEDVQTLAQLPVSPITAACSGCESNNNPISNTDTLVFAIRKSELISNNEHTLYKYNLNDQTSEVVYVWQDPTDYRGLVVKENYLLSATSDGIVGIDITTGVMTNLAFANQNIIDITYDPANNIFYTIVEGETHYFLFSFLLDFKTGDPCITVDDVIRRSSFPKVRYFDDGTNIPSQKNYTVTDVSVDDNGVVYILENAIGTLTDFVNLPFGCDRESRFYLFDHTGGSMGTMGLGCVENVYTSTGQAHTNFSELSFEFNYGQLYGNYCEPSDCSLFLEKLTELNIHDAPNRFIPDYLWMQSPSTNTGFKSFEGFSFISESDLLNSNVTWYNSPTIDTSLHVGGSFNPEGTIAEEGPFESSIPGTFTYYVTCNGSSDCPRTEVVYTIGTTPCSPLPEVITSPIVLQNEVLDNADTEFLVVDCIDAKWFNKATGGEILFEGSHFNPTGTVALEGAFDISIPGNYTYYVQCGDNENCPRQEVIFTIIQDPCFSAPTIVNEPVVYTDEILNDLQSEWLVANCRNFCDDPTIIPPVVDPSKGYRIAFEYFILDNLNRVPFTSNGIEIIDKVTGESSFLNIPVSETESQGIILNGYYIYSGRPNDGPFAPYLEFLNLETGSSYRIDVPILLDHIEINPATGKIYGSTVNLSASSSTIYELEFNSDESINCSEIDNITINQISILQGIYISSFRIDNNGNAYVIYKSSAFGPTTGIGNLDINLGIITNSKPLECNQCPNDDFIEYEFTAVDFPNDENILYGYYVPCHTCGGSTLYAKVDPESGMVTVIDDQVEQLGTIAISYVFPNDLITNFGEVYWYNAPVAGSQQGVGEYFNPSGTTAEEGAFDISVPGKYTYYAQCGNGNDCERIRLEFTVNCREEVTILEEPVQSAGNGPVELMAECNSCSKDINATESNDFLYSIRRFSDPSGMNRHVLSKHDINGQTTDSLFTWVDNLNYNGNVIMNENMLVTTQEGIKNISLLDGSIHDIGCDVSLHDIEFDPITGYFYGIEGNNRIYEMVIEESSNGTCFELKRCTYKGEILNNLSPFAGVGPIPFIDLVISDSGEAYVIGDSGFKGTIIRKIDLNTLRVIEELVYNQYGEDEGTFLFYNGSIIGTAVNERFDLFLPLFENLISIDISASQIPFTSVFDWIEPKIIDDSPQQEGGGYYEAIAFGNDIGTFSNQVSWFSSPSSSSLIFTGSSFNPTNTTAEEGPFFNNVSGTYTYYVSCNDSPNCPRVPVTYTIDISNCNDLPTVINLPTVLTNQILDNPSEEWLVVDCSDAHWYDAPVNGSLQGTGTEFNPTGTVALEGAFDISLPGSYTYYVQCGDNANCPRQEITITVIQDPCFNAPTIINEPVVYTDEILNDPQSEWLVANCRNFCDDPTEVPSIIDPSKGYRIWHDAYFISLAFPFAPRITQIDKVDENTGEIELISTPDYAPFTISSVASQGIIINGYYIYPNRDNIDLINIETGSTYSVPSQLSFDQLEMDPTTGIIYALDHSSSAGGTILYRIDLEYDENSYCGIITDLSFQEIDVILPFDITAFRINNNGTFYIIQGGSKQPNKVSELDLMTFELINTVTLECIECESTDNILTGGMMAVDFPQDENLLYGFVQTCLICEGNKNYASINPLTGVVDILNDTLNLTSATVVTSFAFPNDSIPAFDVTHWYDSNLGGALQGIGDEFDPTGTFAEEGPFDISTPGIYTYYAQCGDADNCTRVKTEFTVICREDIALRTEAFSFVGDAIDSLTAVCSSCSENNGISGSQDFLYSIRKYEENPGLNTHILSQYNLAAQTTDILFSWEDTLSYNGNVFYKENYLLVTSEEGLKSIDLRDGNITDLGCDLHLHDLEFDPISGFFYGLEGINSVYKIVIDESPLNSCLHISSCTYIGDIPNTNSGLVDVPKTIAGLTYTDLVIDPIGQAYVIGVIDGPQTMVIGSVVRNLDLSNLLWSEEYVININMENEGTFLFYNDDIVGSGIGNGQNSNFPLFEDLLAIDINGSSPQVDNVFSWIEPKINAGTGGYYEAIAFGPEIGESSDQVSWYSSPSSSSVIQIGGSFNPTNTTAEEGPFDPDIPGTYTYYVSCNDNSNCPRTPVTYTVEEAEICNEPTQGCDDQDCSNGVEIWDEDNCECILGIPVDACSLCYGQEAGTPCDDGNSSTIDDVWQEAEVQTMRYRVQIRNIWNEDSPAFPDQNAHFSWFGGGTHNGNVKFWEIGTLASAGIDEMAVTGVTTTLLTEVNQAVAIGNAEFPINEMHWFCPDGINHPNCDTMVFEIVVSKDFPLVTLASMLGPSPDWFVGTESLALTDANGEFITQIVQELYPHDAGILSDNSVIEADCCDREPLSVPQQPVHLITTQSGETIGPESLGQIIFTAIPDPSSCLCAGTLTCANLGGDTDGDGVCDDVDNCPTVYNPLQMDIDNDQIGDLCDDCVEDCHSARLGNYVWHDINGDGIQEVTEPGLEGIDVSLFSDAGVLLGSQQTDASGFYLFDDLYSGKYYLQFEDASGEYEFTQFGQGIYDSSDSDVDDSNGPGTTPLIHLGFGEIDLDHDAGMFKCIPIGEEVWFDFNFNHLQENYENGLNGIPIELWQKQSDGTFEKTQQTTSAHKPGTNSDDGYYRFCAPPGTYFMQIDVPYGQVVARENYSGYQYLTDAYEYENDNDFGVDLKTAEFTVTSGMSVLTIDAGISVHAQVGNRVWHDANQNGIQDSGENGIGDVMIEAYDMDYNMISSDLTNQDGFYNIENLGNTTYFLRFEPPLDFTPTQPLVGSDDTKDCDIVNLNGPNTTKQFSMNSGDELKSVDAGFINSSVPLDLLSFDAEKEGERHKIHWATANEVNLSHFEVELSMDNITQFQLKESKATLGSTAGNYVIYNTEIENSGVYYYRLKSVDFNGEFSYSKIRSVEEVSRKTSVHLFPNPTMADISVELNLSDGAAVKIGILDISGKRVDLVNGYYDLERGTHVVNLNTDRLTPGVYVVDVLIGDISYKKKLVKI